MMNFVSSAVGSQTHQKGLGLISLENSWSNLVSVVSEFSARCSRLGFAVTNVFSEMCFLGVSIFPLKISTENSI
jgi:hypothetical protein